MKRSQVLYRGAKGFGWYWKYMKEGNEGFLKAPAPVYFDWKTPSQIPRTTVKISLTVGNKPLDSLYFQLADDVVPKTVQNFISKCTGENEFKRTYRNSKISQVQKGKFILAGQIDDGAPPSRLIPEENFIISHDQRGLLRFENYSC